MPHRPLHLNQDIPLTSADPEVRLVMAYRDAVLKRDRLEAAAIAYYRLGGKSDRVTKLLALAIEEESETGKRLIAERGGFGPVPRK